MTNLLRLSVCLLVVCVVVVSGRRCAPKEKGCEDKCQKNLPCPVEDRYTPSCGCCQQCGELEGQHCTYTKRCASGLTCYSCNKSRFNMWGYDGVCVSEHTLSLLSTPLQCNQRFENPLCEYQ